jgi:GNAT superfamily N-acetyltransferase
MSQHYVQIVPYEPRYRRAAIELASRLQIGVAPWRDPAAVLDAVTGWVEASLNTLPDDNHLVLIAVDDEGLLVGLVTAGTRMHFTGEIDAYVGELVVADNQTRLGTGTRLMRAAERWARSRGHTRLSLETGAANDGARAFYARLGYVEEDVRLTRSLS